MIRHPTDTVPFEGRFHTTRGWRGGPTSTDHSVIELCFQQASAHLGGGKRARWNGRVWCSSWHDSQPRVWSVRHFRRQGSSLGAKRGLEVLKVVAGRHLEGFEHSSASPKLAGSDWLLCISRRQHLPLHRNTPTWTAGSRLVRRGWERKSEPYQPLPSSILLILAILFAKLTRAIWFARRLT